MVKGEILTSIFAGAHIHYGVQIGSRTVIVDVADPSEKGVYQGEIVVQFHPRKIHILHQEGSSRY